MKRFKGPIVSTGSHWHKTSNAKGHVNHGILKQEQSKISTIEAKTQQQHYYPH